jgi:chromosome segregation ATPase
MRGVSSLSPAEDSTYISISEVVHSLQRILLEKEKVIDDQKNKITELQELVKKDHEILKTLDQTVQDSERVIKQRQESQATLERETGALNTKLSLLGTEQERSIEGVKAAKQQIVQLNGQCEIMEKALGKVNAARSENEANMATLQGTFLELTADVRALEVANRQLKSYRRDNDNEELERKVASQGSKFRELDMRQLAERDEIYEKEAQIRTLRAVNAETEAVLTSEVQRLSVLSKRQNAIERAARAQQPGEFERPAAHARGTSRRTEGRTSGEARGLTSQMRDLEHRISQEKRRMAEAQTTLNRARLANQDIRTPTRALRDAETDYLAMKRQKRAVQGELDQLKQLSCNLRDELHCAERVSGRLRSELIESRRRPLVVQPIVKNEESLEWREPVVSQLDRKNPARRRWLERMHSSNRDLHSRMRDLGYDLSLDRDIRNSYFPRSVSPNR